MADPVPDRDHTDRRQRPADGIREHLRLLIRLARTVALGAVSGVLAGLSSWVFLEALDRVTRIRLDHPWLLYLLPLAGVAVAAVYQTVGGRSGGGNALLIEEIHSPTAWVPRRMAPLVLGGTLVSHLFGASVGREGTALQMSGSLTDGASRLLRLGPADRRLMLIAALAGGFGAVFGVPLAGAVFALEVQTVGRVRYDALVPALSASLVGDLVVRGLGYRHGATPNPGVDLGALLSVKVAAAGIVFGLAALAFIQLTHVLARRTRPIPAVLRPLVGGTATVALALLVGRDYLGLSLPLVGSALGGEHVAWWSPLLKLVFTALAIGTGFVGGEVTPLFVIGATLGATLAPLFGLPVPLLAAVGFVAVFGAAANTPLACTIMGVELFGSAMVVPLALGCVVAYVASSHRSIYPAQRPDTPGP